MKRKPNNASRKRDDGWYEVLNTAQHARLIQNVPETEGYRCFVRGPIGGLQIIEVPANMPEAQRDVLGRALSAQGVSVLLVNEHIQFCKLRRASPEEEKRLNESQKESEAQSSGDADSLTETADDSLPGPLAPGDGDSGSPTERSDQASRDDRDEGLARSGTHSADP